MGIAGSAGSVFKDLREFIGALERQGQLVRIREEVDPELEITEIADRTVKRGGPALYFENVKGSGLPVLINAFGSESRMASALGAESLGHIEGEIARLLDEGLIRAPAMEKLRMAGRVLRLAQCSPKRVSKGPCQEVVLRGDEVDLGLLPVLKCWPKDAGRFITLPTVITRDPETGARNAGVYRMQVLDRRTTAMHWQTQKDGAVQAQKARRGGRKLEAAVVIGCDPATVMAGVLPLPHGMDELLFSGVIRGSPLEMVRCLSVDLEVPARAEIVLEGTVDPEDLRTEGPFGDHTGVYTPPEPFPAFHVSCMTMRRDAVYLATVVGKPPMEDYYMGKAAERMFLPVLKKQLPELVDMNLPMEGTLNNAVILSIDKQYPFQARKTVHAVWGLGQLSYSKVVIVVEKDVNVHDPGQVALTVFNNIDPKRDVFFSEGPVDTLNHASPVRDFGSKMGIDATRKWKEEGYERPWPEEIQMSPEIKRKVDERLGRMEIG